MFSELFKTGGKKVTPETLELWGQEASKLYLDEKTPLNQSITKIAQDNELNPEQIARVVEFANVTTYTGLFDREKEKTFEFPVADTNKVLDQFNKHSAAPIKTNERIFEKTSGKKIGFFELLKVAKSEKKKISPYKVMEAIEKLSAVKDELNCQRLEGKRMQKEAERKFYSVVKEMIYEGTSLETLYKTAQEIAPDLDNKTLFKTVIDQLFDEGVLEPFGSIKLSSQATEVQDHLVDRTVPVSVINGDHNFVILLNTIKKCRDNVALYTGTMGQIDDQADYIRMRVREL